MRADNRQHIIEAARRRSECTRSKAIQALRSLDAAGEPVAFDAVAEQAGVSRSWLYGQPDLRAEVERLRAAHRQAPASPVPARRRTSDASLLRRLEAANTRVRQLAEENRRLRDQLASGRGEQRADRIASNQARGQR
ncbi:DUF6262 family protein [Streptomyces sp. NPDC086182]|jgi:hypothetical protein|uniref:DUF6262 family protein n=1 Tax=Streptomyces sp. NPDC086182 TaxID=3155058 RepID=UPI00342D4260